jgi:hypothetical protein
MALEKPEPQDSVRSLEAGMRVRAQGNLELMAKEQVLEHEIPARPSSGSTTGNCC